MDFGRFMTKESRRKISENKRHAPCLEVIHGARREAVSKNSGKKIIGVVCLGILLTFAACGRPNGVSHSGTGAGNAAEGSTQGSGSLGNIAPEEGAAVWEKRIYEEELTIPGIQGEYDLLFVTDAHAVLLSENDSEQEAENGAARMGLFQNAEGVSAARQFSEWMDYAIDREMDAVLLGGDIIDYPSQGSLTYLTETLGKLDMPYIYTLGNHDWTFPWEYMTETGKEEYLPLLAPFMEQNTAVHFWENEEFVVVAVDNSTNQVNGEALEEYEKILQKGKPVIVVLHVPFMTQSALEQATELWNSPVVIGGGNYGGIYPNGESDRFFELTTAADSPVELVLAGHVHFYDSGILYGEKEVPQLVGDAGFHGSAMHLHITGRR